MLSTNAVTYDVFWVYRFAALQEYANPQGASEKDGHLSRISHEG